MKPADDLALFVQDGLRAGHNPTELRAALSGAGWSATEIDSALNAWGDAGLRLPVPRPRPSVSGRDVLIYGLMAVTLLGVTWHLVQLSFGLIDIWLADPFRDSFHNAASMRWSIAVLIVGLPLFLWLNHRAETTSHADPGQRKSPIRKKFGAGALFLSALVLLGNAVAVVYTILSGEMTGQFVAKAGVVACVAVLVLLWGRSFLHED